MHAQAQEAAQAFQHAIALLKQLADNASTASGFSALDEALQASTRHLDGLAYVHAAHAYSATLAHAGDTIGSTNARDYLTSTLGISNREASVRIKRGQIFLQPLEQKDAEYRSQMKEIFLAGTVGTEKLDAINTALLHVPKDSDIDVEAIRAQGFRQAADRSVEDLRAWMKETLDAQAEDLTPETKRAHTHRRRKVRFGPQDRYGGVRFEGYLPGEAAAVVKQALTQMRHTLAARDREASERKGTKISRSADQYAADALKDICGWALRHHDDKREASLHGTASLLISVVADEAPQQTYETSNGLWLTEEEVRNLLGDKYDWLAVHDSYTGFPLALGRTRRGASWPQKVALFAHQGVCAYPGCHRSLDRCQTHHIKPWSKGGATDLENLTLMCTYHHGFNDDDGTSEKRGRIERDPDTMRPTNEFKGTRTTNESASQQRSAGHRIRHRRRE